MSTLVVTNTTDTDVVLSVCGLTVPGSGNIEVTGNEIQTVFQDGDFRAAWVSGALTLAINGSPVNLDVIGVNLASDISFEQVNFSS